MHKLNFSFKNMQRISRLKADNRQYNLLLLLVNYNYTLQDYYQINYIIGMIPNWYQHSMKIHQIDYN